jgi:hypothetical protein
MTTRAFAITAGMLAAGSLMLAGCLGTGSNMYPMQNMSRVPPPGTGTYTPPGNYYRSAPGSGANVGLQPVQGSSPTADWSGSNGMVQPAQFAGAASSNSPVQSSPVQPASYSQSSAASAARDWSTSMLEANQLTEGRFQSYGSDSSEPRQALGDEGFDDPALQWQP